MDNGYVLSIPEDLASLELDMNQWLNLPYDLRKEGNDNCIRKYGCTNEQLYNIIKAKLVNVDISDFDKGLRMDTYIYKNKRILKGITESTFKVDPEDEVSGFTDDGQINDRLNRINRSNQICNSDDDIVIINDFLSDKSPDYTIEDLEAKYNNYLSTNFDHRLRADNFSYEIWGRSVSDMYNYMKDKMETIKLSADSGSNYTPNLEQQRLDSYRNTVVNESANDTVNKIIRCLDCKKHSKSRSIYESYILEQFGDTITIGGKTYRQDMPGVMPFLTYYEYLHNTQHLDQRKIHAKNPFCYVLNRINNKKNIEDAYNNHDNEALLNMGWNPYIKPTTEAFKHAYERQIKFFDENYGFEIYDISKFHTNIEDDNIITESVSKSLTPIFITLLGNTNNPEKIVDRKYTYKDFAKMGLSLSSSLSTVYGYELQEDYVDRIRPKDKVTKYLAKDNDKMNVVYKLKKIDVSKIETDKITLHVLTFFVTSDIKKAIREGINLYMSNQDNSKYAFDSILTVLNNKRTNRSLSLTIMVATFLDSIFRVANLYDKNSDRQNISFDFKGKSTRNEDGSNKRKIYIMYNGDVNGYKSKKIDKNINWLLKNVDKTTMNFFDNSYTDQPDYYDFDTYMHDFKSTNESAEYISLIESMKDILTPTSFIQESNLFDYTVEDIDRRYHIAISLLDSYNETELEGIKKQCKELFILYNICSIVLKNAKNDPDTMKLQSILVSINNKLNFYIKMIKGVEPEFDIKEYSKPNYDIDHDIRWKNSVYIYSANNFKYTPSKEDI